jgi:hypothetical protein
VTSVSEIANGVDLVVTAVGDPGAREIRRRADALATASGAETRHAANGAGGGHFGRCPVVMRNTTVSASAIPGGSRIHVVPRDTGELHWLRRETETRAAQLSDPAIFGAGKMSNCPNAVPGSGSRATDTPKGVDVEITGPMNALDEIRRRAHAVADVPGGDPRSRCPVTVLRATVGVSFIAGGAKVSVEASDPHDVDQVRTTVRDRMADFEPPRAR